MSLRKLCLQMPASSFGNARHAKQYFAQKKGIVVSFARMEMLHVHPFRQRGRVLTAAKS